MALGDTISLEGFTATPWPFPPASDPLERLEWATDVLPSFGGEEQRVALRACPRRSFEWAHVFKGRERRTAANLLRGRQAGTWALPVWPDAVRLVATLSGGASSVPADTATRDFVAGGKALLVGADPHDYEVVSVDSTTGSAVLLSAPTASAWPAGTALVPLRAASLEDETSAALWTGDAGQGKLRWLLEGASDWPAASGEATYRDQPVLELVPSWAEDPQQATLSQVDRLDPQVGLRFYDQRAGQVSRQVHQYLLADRAEIAAFRSWAYARQGMCGSFWAATCSHDLLVVADIGSGDTFIDVEHAAYSAALDADIGRRDIRIDTWGGTYWRRITAAAAISSSVERLVIDSALGADVPAAGVRQVSFADLVRQESDAVEIQWWGSEAARTAITVRGSRNDL